MARVVEVRNVDDVDGGPADETVNYSIDGIEYEIDLSESNAEQFRAAFAPWIESSRRAPNRRGGRRTATTKHLHGGKTSNVDPTAVREWARKSGIEVSTKGRIPTTLIEQYLAAKKVQ